MFAYLRRLKKKRAAAERELPPYDKAILALDQLENSQYLIKEEYKAYYSELTNIVRGYLEEEVHVAALESTTDQLIERLELLRDSGALTLESETITQFKQILQTADGWAVCRPCARTAHVGRLARNAAWCAAVSMPRARPLTMAQPCGASRCTHC